jgi:hypothetical protein
MLNPDFFLGLTAILAPFALVGAAIIRQRNRENGSRQNGACIPLNSNGLPMMGAVDANGNSVGTVHIHNTNVNGMPMAGAVDVCGSSFGTFNHTY